MQTPFILNIIASKRPKLGRKKNDEKYTPPLMLINAIERSIPTEKRRKKCFIFVYFRITPLHTLNAQNARCEWRDRDAFGYDTIIMTYLPVVHCDALIKTFSIHAILTKIDRLNAEKPRWIITHSCVIFIFRSVYRLNKI